MKNDGNSVEATLQQLQEALAKWNKLPEARRRPAAVNVPPHGPLDQDYSRNVPEGGLVLKVHARILDKTDNGFRRGTCDFFGGERASRDYAWFTAEEAKSLLPSRHVSGETYRLPYNN